MNCVNMEEVDLNSISFPKIIIERTYRKVIDICVLCI